MQSVSDNVYVEDQFPGVTLGVIAHPHGLIQIDAPPSPEDGRSWRAAMLNLGGGPERILINLDAHPDRTLGARAMDCPVIAHDETSQIFRSRPTTFKVQVDETGADWENIPGIGSVRWVIPEISFSQTMTLHWGDTPIILEHHPGSAVGAVWVIMPEEKVVFIGDAVVKNQPPFLASANLPVWIDELEYLLSQEFRGFTVVSGRGGSCANSTIRNQQDFLKKAFAKLEKLSGKQSPPEATESMIQSLLSTIKFGVSLQEHYARRLRYGLQNYYQRHYWPSPNGTEE
jgi:glyoxylase-like metal-dependent hydrolase (beta-lactamase superfamily II)